MAIARLQVRQVLLNPFSGEYEWLAAFIGTTYDVEHYSCQLEKACLFFATRREGSGTDVNEYYQNGSSGGMFFIALLIPKAVFYCR